MTVFDEGNLVMLEFSNSMFLVCMTLVPLQLAVQFSFDGPKFAGDHVQLMCSTQGDVPAHASFQWAFHGADPSTQKEVQVTRIGPKTSILTIAELDAKHTGSYSCSISDFTSKSIELVVNGTDGGWEFTGYACMLYLNNCVIVAMLLVLSSFPYTRPDINCKS